MCSNYSPSEQEVKELEERNEKEERDLKAMASSYAVEKGRVHAGVIEMEQEAKREGGGVEAKHNRQLTGLNRRLQGEVDASARLEQEPNRRLQDSASTSAADLAQLEQKTKGREQVETEINTSVAYRIKLEEEIQELLGRMGTAYVRVSFCPVTHDN